MPSASWAHTGAARTNMWGREIAWTSSQARSAKRSAARAAATPAAAPDRGISPPALAAVSFLQHPRSDHRRRFVESAGAARKLRRTARSAGREHAVLSRRANCAWLQHHPRRAPDRADHARRRCPGSALCRKACSRAEFMSSVSPIPSCRMARRASAPRSAPAIPGKILPSPSMCSPQ